MPAAEPPKFRRRGLDLVAGGEPVAAVAFSPTKRLMKCPSSSENLGISESCLRRWMSQLSSARTTRSRLSTLGTPELRMPVRMHVHTTAQRPEHLRGGGWAHRMYPLRVVLHRLQVLQ